MKYLSFLVLLIGIGCAESETNLPAGLDYFPKESLIKKGIVYKYYDSRGKIGTPLRTNILYRKVSYADNEIINEDYDAGFEKTHYQRLEIKGSKWLTKEEQLLVTRTEVEVPFAVYTYSLDENVHSDWEENDAKMDKTVLDEGIGSRIVSRQELNKDTIIDDKQIKIFGGTRLFFPINEDGQGDSTLYQWEKQYEKGLGMVYSKMTNGKFEYIVELDEVMTSAEFERRAEHGTHRVGYIDTLKTLDDHTAFETCFLPSKINDYYNDDRAGFIGGKGRLKAVLKSKLDPTKLEGESGYLTYRFVINCEGKAGWFVTEEADLDFQKKKFSNVSKQHLFEVLKSEKEWKPLAIWGESRDAYTYITFKLKNGEIIEILP